MSGGYKRYYKTYNFFPDGNFDSSDESSVLKLIDRWDYDSFEAQTGIPYSELSEMDITYLEAEPVIYIGHPMLCVNFRISCMDGQPQYDGQYFHVLMRYSGRGVAACAVWYE